MPGLVPPRMSGRSSAAAAESAGDRPVSAAPGPSADAPGVVTGYVPKARADDLQVALVELDDGLVEHLGDVENAGEEEERKPERDEEVAHRHDVVEHGHRDRDDVGQRSEVEEEARIERGRQHVWSAGETSAGVKPAARRLGSQTGMYPPFTRITMPFIRLPTKARLMPGKRRFAHSAYSSSANDAA